MALPKISVSRLALFLAIFCNPDWFWERAIVIVLFLACVVFPLVVGSFVFVTSLFSGVPARVLSVLLGCYVVSQLGIRAHFVYVVCCYLSWYLTRTPLATVYRPVSNGAPVVRSGHLGAASAPGPTGVASPPEMEAGPGGHGAPQPPPQPDFEALLRRFHGDVYTHVTVPLTTVEEARNLPIHDYEPTPEQFISDLGPLASMLREQLLVQPALADRTQPLAEAVGALDAQVVVVLREIARSLHTGGVEVVVPLVEDLIESVERVVPAAQAVVDHMAVDDPLHPVVAAVMMSIGVIYHTLIQLAVDLYPALRPIAPDLVTIITRINERRARILVQDGELQAQGGAFSIPVSVSVEDETRESAEYVASRISHVDVVHTFPGLDGFLAAFMEAGRKSNIPTGVLQKCVGGILAAIAVARTSDRLARVCIIGAWVAHLCTPFDLAGSAQAALTALASWVHEGPTAQAGGPNDTETLVSVVGGCFTAICSIFEPKSLHRLRLDKAAVDLFSAHVMAALRVGDLVTFAMRLVTWARSTAVRLTCGYAPLEDYSALLERATTWAQNVLEVRTQNTIQDFATTPEKVAKIAALREEGNDLVRLSFARKELATLATHVQRLNTSLTDFHESIRSFGTLAHRRPEPYAVYMFGIPGQGKSTVVDLLIATAVTAFGLQYTPAMRYTRNSVSKHWNNYHGQFACVFDDLLQIGDLNLRAAEIADWIHCVNSMPYLLEMASLEEKRATFFTSALMIATTNERQFINSNRTGITDPGAFHRRRDLVLEVVLESAVGRELDPDKWVFLSYDPVRESTPERLTFAQVAERVVHGIAQRLAGALDRQREINKIATEYAARITEGHDVFRTAIQAQNGDEEVAPNVVAASSSAPQPVEGAGVGDTDTDSDCGTDTGENPSPSKRGNHRQRRNEARAAEKRSRLERAKMYFAARYAEWTHGGPRETSEEIRQEAAAVQAMHQAVIQLHTQTRGIMDVLTQRSKDILAQAGELTSEVRERYDAALATHKWIGHMTSAVTALVTVWTMWRTYKWATGESDTCKRQHDEFAHFVEPEGRGVGMGSDERKLMGRRKDWEVWKTRPGGGDTVTYIRGGGDYFEEGATYHPESTADETALSIEKSIRDNFVRVRVVARDPDGVTHKCATTGTFVKGNVILTAAHLARLATMYVDEQGRSNAVIQFEYPHGAITDIPARDCDFLLHKADLALIVPPPTVRARPTVIKHFIKEADVQVGPLSELKLVGLAGNGTFTRLDAPRAELQTAEPKQYSAYGFDFRIPRAIVSLCDTEAGDCGSVYILYNKRFQRKLVGIHTAGSALPTDRAVGSLVTQELLEEMLAGVKPRVAELALPEWVPQGATNEEPNVRLGPTFEVLAVVPPHMKPRMPEHTEIHPSAIEPLLHDVKRTKAPAPLRPFKNADGVRIKPLEVASDFPSHHVGAHISFEELEAVAGTLYQEMGRNIEARVLTEFENINGDPAIGLEKLAMDSSPGYPHVLKPRRGKGKRDWYVRMHDSWVMGDELRAEVEAAEACLARGERFGAIFMDIVKDELIKLAKVEAGKARLLGASPHVLTLLVRKYFGRGVQQFIVNRRNHFGSVGIRPDSQEWREQYEYLTSIADGEWMAGDFREFFATHPANVVYFVLYQLTKWYDPEVTLETWRERQPQRFALAQEIVHAVHIIGNVVYVTDHGHPSGSGLTTFINTMATEVYLRLCFVQCVEPVHLGITGPVTVEDYRRHTRNKAFGDDHNTRVSAAVAPYFNQRVFADWCRRYNLEYTDAYKNADPEPFTSDEDLVFLKRKYAVRANGWIDAPMDLQVLREMVLWITGPTGDQRRTAQVIENSLEMACEHPREVFTDWKQRLGSAMALIGWRYGFEVRDIHYDVVRNKRPGYLHAQSGADELATAVVESQHELTAAQEKEAPGPSTQYVQNLLWRAGPSFPGQDFGAAFRRRYIVDNIDMPSGQTPGHVMRTVNVMEWIMSQTVLVAALTRFRYWRADVHLTFKFNASIYHGGAIGVLFTPPMAAPGEAANAGAGAGAAGVETLQSLITGYHTIISADKWRVMEMTVPFIRSVPWVDNETQGNGFLQQLGRLHFMCVAPIVTGLATASSTLTLTVEMELRNVEVDCPYYYSNPDAVGVLRAQGGDDHREKRRKKPQVEEAKRKAETNDGEAAESHTWVQTVARYVGAGVERAINWAVPAVGRFLFGLSKPTDVSTQVLAVVDPRARHGVADGVDNTNSLGIFQAHGVSADPQVFGWLGDAMDLGVRARHPGFLMFGYFDGTYDTGDQIASWVVHPLYCPVIGDTTWTSKVVRHHLAHTASHFRYWRGSLKYRIHFFAPRTMTARVRVWWSAAPGVFPFANTGDVPNMIVDISGDTVVNVSVPHSGMYLWRKVALWVDDGQMLTGTDRINGQLKMEVVNPVIAMDFAESSRISFLITVAGGEDFDVAEHVGIVANGMTYRPVEDPPRGLTAQGSEHEEFASAFEPIAQGRSVLYDGLVHGEQVKSWREVLKRYQYAYWNVLSPVNGDTFHVPHSTTNWASLDQADILSAFRFARGSRRSRYNVWLTTTNPDAPWIVATLSTTNPQGTPVAAPSGPSAYPPVPIDTAEAKATVSQVNVEAPFYKNVAYTEVDHYWNGTTVPDSDAQTVCFVVPSGGSSLRYNQYVAFGDDFTAGWPRCPNPVWIPAGASRVRGADHIQQQPSAAAARAAGGGKGRTTARQAEGARGSDWEFA